MKKLLVALFIVGLIGGCGVFGDDGSDEEQFKSYTIGTWEITQPEKGEWKGGDIMNKANPTTSAIGDTLVVTDTESHSITITDDPQNEGVVHFTYIDSMLTSTTYDTTNWDFGAHDYTFNIEEIGIAGIDTDLNSERYKRTIGLYYIGTPAGHDPIEMINTNYNEDGSVFKAYKFNLEGMGETILEVCNDC